MSITTGYDCIRTNIGSLPKGAAMVAGYSTGDGDVPWGAADWAAHPHALRICQDHALSDHTADYGDIEQFAGVNSAAPGFYTAALAAYKAGTRPGQRWPGFYTSASNVTPLANTLVAAGIHSGPRLIIANWNLSDAQARADLAAAMALLAAGGPDPFPIVGYQFADPGPYDIDVWSTAWLDAVSQAPHPPPPPPRIIPTPAQLARAYQEGRAPSQMGKLFIDGAWYAVELIKQ